MEVAPAKLGGEDNKLAKLYNEHVNSSGAKDSAIRFKLLLFFLLASPL